MTAQEIPDTSGLDPLRYDAVNEHPDEVGGMLRHYMPENVRVLDIGCGTASVTLVANRGKGNQVVCLEPDPRRAALARERGFEVHESVLTADMVEQLGAFDVVVFADVLEHMTHPEDAIALTLRALKPGGLLIASVPNVAHWSMRVMLLFGVFEYQDVGIRDVTHLRWFTAKSFRRLISNAGLEIYILRQTAGVDLGLYRKVTLGLVPYPIRSPIIRALARLFPRLIGCQHVVVARKPVNP